MKKIIFALVLLFPLFLISCDSDDDNLDLDKVIVGQWGMENSQWQGKYYGSIKFESNGSGYYQSNPQMEFDNVSHTFRFVYEITGDVMKAWKTEIDGVKCEKTLWNSMKMHVVSRDEVKWQYYDEFSSSWSPDYIILTRK